MRYRDFLRIKLGDRIPSSSILPSGFHLVGHVALVHLNFDTMKYASFIGEKTLEYDHRILSVAVRTGPTEGITRLPSYTLVAGNRNTTTTHIEDEVKFHLDPLRFTFSGGNRRERMRVSKLAKDGEKVVDMFSCVGQFALPIAKSADVEVTAMEINNNAYQFLLENIRLNRLERRVVAILGDCREVHPKKAANRVIMGYLHDTIDYLPYAIDTLVEEGGVVHMHMNVPEFRSTDISKEIEQVCGVNGYSSVIEMHHVKNYSPGVGHYVFDISISEA
ncbi:MAG: class I SAM-dependent methyltransferase [Candidatus Thorarchaeota archaeon]|jgi:tRNA G37 N-methylase Trm5